MVCFERHDSRIRLKFLAADKLLKTGCSSCSLQEQVAINVTTASVNDGGQLFPEFAALFNPRSHTYRVFIQGLTRTDKTSRPPRLSIPSLQSVFLSRSIASLSQCLSQWSNSLCVALVVIFAVIFGLLAKGNMTREDRAELSTRPRGRRRERVRAEWKVRISRNDCDSSICI